jgi:hypothetical protein
MGGGVYLSGKSEFIMESGLITRNKTKMSGGGVFPDDGGKFTMLGGVISDNEAFVSGAGVFVGIDAHFVMRNGSIKDNIAGGEKIIKIAGVSIPYGEGGGVFVSSKARFVMENGRIENNRAIAVGREDEAGSGGGVFVEAGGVFAIESGVITKNGVMNWGGGVYSEGFFTSNSKCIIGNNIARLGGGGVHIAGNKGVFLLKDGWLINNYTAGTGGAIHVTEGGSLTMEGGFVAENRSGGLGNGLAINSLAAINGGVIVGKLGILEDADAKNAETGVSPEETPCIIVVEEKGKLIIQNGEIEGRVAMKKTGIVEDRREKKEPEQEL